VNTYQKFRRTIFRVLDADSRATGFERAGNFAVVALILANVAAVILESVPWVYTRYGAEFLRFEVFSVTVFTIEYLLRLWTCVEKDNYRRPIVGRLQFAVSPIALLDFAAILPSYLPGEVFLDLRFARIIRALRMVRILKFARYSRTLQTFGAVFHQKRTDIGLMTLFLVLIVVISIVSHVFRGTYRAAPAVRQYSCGDVVVSDHSYNSGLRGHVPHHSAGKAHRCRYRGHRYRILRATSGHTGGGIRGRVDKTTC